MAKVGGNDMYKLLIDGTLDQKLGNRFNFTDLAVIGSGSFGVVFQESFLAYDGQPIIRKVDCITQTQDSYLNTKALDEVIYKLEEDNGKKKYLLSCDQELSILNPDQTLRLQQCVTQYEALRDLKGQKYFQEITPHPDIEVDREFFFLDGRLYVQIWMKKLPGTPISKYMKKNSVIQPGLLHPFDFATIAEQSADALMILAKNEIEHGDINPTNIVVNENEKKSLDIGVIDLGCGNLKRAQRRNKLRGKDTQQLLDTILGEEYAIGAKGYMSPEKLRGKSCIESDAFALGVTLYTILTGNLPFKKWIEPLHMTLEDEERIYVDLARHTDYASEVVHAITQLMSRDTRCRNLRNLREVMKRKREDRTLMSARPSYVLFGRDMTFEDLERDTEQINKPQEKARLQVNVDGNASSSVEEKTKGALSVATKKAKI